MPRPSLDEIFATKPVVLSTDTPQRPSLESIFAKPLAQPQPKERGVFEDIAQGGGRILTERGINILKLLDEATGGALMSHRVREASNRALQNLNKEKEQEGTAGSVAGFAADPVNLMLPFARGLSGVKALVATGAVGGALSGALSNTGSGNEDRLADTALGGAVGGIAGPIVGKTLETVMSPVQTVKNAISGLGKSMKVSPEAVRTFEEAGLSPLVGDVAASGRVQRSQNILEDAPFAGDIITGAKEKLSTDVKGKLAQIGFDENAERIIGGSALKQGLKNYVDKGRALFSGQKGKNGEIIKEGLFDRFDRKYISPDEKTTLTSTTAKINDILSRADTPEALDAYLGSTEKSIIAKIQSASQPDVKPSAILDSSGNPFAKNPSVIGKPPELTYNDLKLFRTSIGKKLEDFQIGSSDKAILRELYQAMTDDMRNKASTKGEEALQAFDRLNSGYSKFLTKLDDTINEVLNKGETTEIFNAVRSGLPLPERTATIMRALPQKNRDIVRGSLIRELGMNRAKAGQGEFDVGKFVTSYNALEPKAQKALLIGLPADVQNNFRKVMEASTLALKTGLQGNPSGTAKNAGMMLLLTSFLKAPIKTTAGLTGGAITAKMMTSPKFIKWLANAPKQFETNPAKYIARLSAIAASDEANREDIENFQQQLGKQ